VTQQSDLIAKLRAKAEEDVPVERLLLDELRAMRAQLDVLEKREKKNGNGNGNGNGIADWPKVRTGLLVTLLAAVIGGIFGTFLLSRDNSRDIKTSIERIEKLEEWRTRHTEQSK